jgi:putative phosphoribosyl transferase
VIAVPVAPEDTLERMAKQKLADEIVCVSAPKDFAAIGQFYFDFSQVHAKDAVKMFRDTNLQSTSE